MTVGIDLLAEKTKALFAELPVLEARVSSRIELKGRESVLLQEGRTIDQFSIRGENLHVLTRMLEHVSFGHLFLHFGDGCVFILSTEEILHILDLISQCVVREFVKVLPKHEPHAYAENELRKRENGKVPERE